MAGGGKQSMLDVILKQMKEDNRDQVIHCITLVSRLSPAVNDKRDVGMYYEVLFQQCHQQYQGEGPTGLLLVYPEHVVHILEGCWELVEAVIRDTCDTSGGGLLTDTRILHFSTNVVPRLYPQWAYRVLSLPSLAKGEVYQTTETNAQTVSHALSTLYKLGAHLSRHHHQMKATLDNLTPQFLLDQDMLEYFTKCDDLDTPSQFIDRYCTPTHVVLDSELVWPLPTRLFPYDD